MTDKVKKIGWLSAVIGSGAIAVLSPDTVDLLLKHLSEASRTEFAKSIFIFSLAAVIHSGRMKKEIRQNFETLIMSIDRVSATLREDLSVQAKRLDGISSRVDDLERKTIKI